VGLVAPYAARFCDACNRVRVSAAGNLRPCLFGGAEIPLRRHLRPEAPPDALRQAIRAAVRSKPASHRLREGDPGGTASLATIGG
jgi:cyclic pyranopterin phosphate synthase